MVMRLFKINSFFVGVLLMLTLSVSQVLAQSDEDKAEVRQHRSGVMMQISSPSDSTPDSSMIQVIKSDSAVQTMNIKTLKELEKMKVVKTKELSYDPQSMVRQRMKQAIRKYEGPPVGIRTEAGKGNRVVVYVKNRTDQPLTDLSIKPDQMPNNWKSQPESHKLRMLPAGHQQTVSFLLQVSSTQPRNVGFELQSSDGFNIGWTARVALAESAGKETPDTFEMHGNYPNPFNPTTTISYSLPQTMNVRLTVFNILGQKVATLVDSEQQAGVQNITWDASRIASGTYLYRVVAQTADGQRFVSEQKMVLIK